jgi:hypothetical protein
MSGDIQQSKRILKSSSSSSKTPNEGGMFNHRTGTLVVSLVLLLAVLGCQPAATAVPAAPTAASASEPPPAEAARSLVIVIPEDPPSFNAVVADSGYDALVMHLTMLGMAEIDPAGRSTRCCTCSDRREWRRGHR